jgi:hypothetical protein
MRQIAILITIIFGLNLYGQRIDKDEYVSFTSVIVSNALIKDNLIKYARLDNHPIYDTNRVFILDTNQFDREIIINDNSPKFIITNASDLKTGYVNYWLLPTEINLKGDKLKYSFKTQSFKWQDSTEYIQGDIKLKKENDVWTIQKIDIMPYDFKELEEIECYVKKVDCESSFDRPEKSRTNNPFFGDWQYLEDSAYYEAYFTDDTLYSYGELLGHSPYDQKYEITEDKFIIHGYDSTILTFNYTIIDKNTIRIFGENEIVWQNDTSIYSTDFTIERIKKREFKYSDVKCWGIWNQRFHCFIDSYDGEKFQEEFWKRMWKFKDEKWDLN